MYPSNSTQPRNSEEFAVGATLAQNSYGSLEPLLAAFWSLSKTGRPCKLIIFAEHDAHQLDGVASLQALPADVRWVPNELPTRELLEGCDVLVSLQYGVPLLVLQARSLRIPIITTAVRVPEALQNQRTVVFIHPGDKYGLQEALLRLAEQPKQRAFFAKDETISKYYSHSYLWREDGPTTRNMPASKGRALIKKALFGIMPSKQLLEHGNRHTAQIALTIDDGPDPAYTPRILNILRDRGVKATFFVVGGAAEQYPKIVARMKEEGHEVGSHSYSHPYFHQLSWEGAIREINMTQWVLDRILGQECKLFRPPHGKLSLRSLIPAWAAGQHVVMWNIDLKDYRASVGEVEAQLDRTFFSSGDIILYHGVNEASLRALPYVIDAALDQGREAVTISELIRH
ncbi:MAG TPA: polysaccharide deacetylase family protein [Terriglobales bacterium]|nr:polysaccharide deacetylase family protein [Terriglobales bacterium]